MKWAYCTVSQKLFYTPKIFCWRFFPMSKSFETEIVWVYCTFYYTFISSLNYSTSYNQKAAIARYFIASVSPFGTPNESASVPQKWVKEDAYFSLKCSSIWTNIFPFSHVEPFGYYSSPNDSTVKFLAKFGAMSRSPGILGTRRRIQSRDIKTTTSSSV